MLRMSIAYKALTGALATTQVPYWLQILSVTLAPVFGFVGVAIGAVLAERNRRKAYVAEERRKTYQEFLEILSEFNLFVATDFISSAKSGDRERFNVAMAKDSQLYNRLLQVYGKIRLVGSPAAVEEANAALSIPVSAATEALSAGRYDPGAVRAITLRNINIQEEFTKIARRDLGLRKSDITLPATNPNPPLSSDQKAIHEALELLINRRAKPSKSAKNRATSSERPGEVPDAGDQVEAPPATRGDGSG